MVKTTGLKEGAPLKPCYVQWPCLWPPGFAQAALLPRETLVFCTLSSRRHISPVQEILSPSGSEAVLPHPPTTPSSPSFSEALWLVWGLLMASSPTSGNGLKTWLTPGQPGVFFLPPPAPRLRVLSLTHYSTSGLTGFVRTRKALISPLTQSRWAR